MSDDNEDPVGYKKPPKQHQFKKGQSGNPGGRRRRTPATIERTDLASILERVGNRKLPLNGEEVSLIEMEIMALQRKAATGDVAASKHLTKLRSDAGVGVAPVQAGGVLVVPGMRPLHEWSISAAIQQAKFREPPCTLYEDGRVTEFKREDEGLDAGLEGDEPNEV